MCFYRTLRILAVVVFSSTIALDKQDFSDFCSLVLDSENFLRNDRKIGHLLSYDTASCLLVSKSTCTFTCD